MERVVRSGGSAGGGSWRRWSGVMLRGAAGLGAAALALRAVWSVEGDHEGAAVLVSFAAFAVGAAAFHIAIGLGALAGAGVVLRRWWTAGCLGVLAAMFAWPAAQDAAGGLGGGGAVDGGLRLVGTAGEGRDGGAVVTVLSLNCFVGRADAGEVAALIDRTGADVVVFQEFSGAIVRELPGEVGGALPFRFRVRTGMGLGLGVWSAFPFAEEPRVLRAGGGFDAGWDQLAVELALDGEGEPDGLRSEGEGGRRLVVVNVHLPNPMSARRVVGQQRVVDRVLGFAGERAGEAMVLVGDFNATAASRTAARVRGAGFRDAQREAGRGLGFTHSVAGRLRGWMPGVRIDHAYGGAGVEVVGFETLDWVSGSDHRPIVARFRVLD